MYADPAWEFDGTDSFYPHASVVSVQARVLQDDGDRCGELVVDVPEGVRIENVSRAAETWQETSPYGIGYERHVLAYHLPGYELGDPAGCPGLNGSVPTRRMG